MFKKIAMIQYQSSFSDYNNKISKTVYFPNEKPNPDLFYVRKINKRSLGNTNGKVQRFPKTQSKHSKNTFEFNTHTTITKGQRDIMLSSHYQQTPRHPSSITQKRRSLKASRLVFLPHYKTDITRFIMWIKKSQERATFTLVGINVRKFISFEAKSRLSLDVCVCVSFNFGVCFNCGFNII